MKTTTRAIGLLLLGTSLASCDPGSLTPEVAPEAAPTPTELESASTPADDIDVSRCRRLKVPSDKEVNTFLDRENGILEFSYYVAKLQQDRSVTIRYLDDPWCRRNSDTRRLIFHGGAGKDLLGCIELPAEAPDGMTRVELWFTDMDDPTFIGSSVVVERDIPTTDSIAAATLQAWIDGPTDEEAKAGALPTAPNGTKLLGIDLDGDTATVDLSRDFERTNLGTTGEGQIMNALAGTLTQFDTIERGLLMIDGESKDSFMGHGLMVSEEHPLMRPRPKRYRVAATC